MVWTYEKQAQLTIMLAKQKADKTTCRCLAKPEERETRSKRAWKST